jgi:tubulin-folding cofactor B
LYTYDFLSFTFFQDDNALIGSYPIEAEGMRIHITDPERTKGELEDTTNVAKFELSKDEYAKKTGTVQDFLKKNRIGKYNPEEVAKLEADKAKLEKEEKDAASKITIGNRVEVRAPAAPTRRGEVKFVGEVHFKPGYWVGVQYDEPHGKNDGSVGGKRYFTCPDKYGGFVKVANVTVGDFPEEGISDDEM